MRFLNKIYAICGLIAAVLLPSCGNEVTVDQMVQDARDSYADGDYASCERLCNDILENKQPELTETQYGSLAVLFMKLSETENPEENTAEATKCYIEAMKLSSDSMKGFMSRLAPEDLPHFVTVTRLGSFLTRRPDLTDEYAPADSALMLPQASEESVQTEITE